ncbi:Error-prone repair protein ImuA [Niastella vici]|uniref:Error-prone repair protein ImuA n=1 Tax=Niastella vici TaxID=1703345 RepID=A0A1V9FUI0_9BACT|nr:Error-prone repair protein ImuA [Niastella vici]OQP62002.1 Error-prone repair protein ImuA [Niastella vici]
MAAKADIIAQLQKEILLLQGFKPASNDVTDWVGLEQIRSAFPNSTFPKGAIHEFFCTGPETIAASTGFITCLLSSLLKLQGATIWISSTRIIFPPSLKAFGIDPEKVLFINVRREKDKLFAMEEALKCDSIAAVIGHIDAISFTESRRFQLAVEQSKVTGFLLRCNPKNLITSCVTRWQITPAPGKTEDNLPGLGFPTWFVQLLKVRNGKPGSWEMQWRSGKLLIVPEPIIRVEPLRKIV